MVRRTTILIFAALLGLGAATLPRACAESGGKPIEQETVLPPRTESQDPDPKVGALYKKFLDESTPKEKIQELPTKLSIMIAGKWSLGPQGKVGDGSTFDIIRYTRGWSDGRGFDMTLGMDVGYVGFFVNFAFDLFDSRSTTFVGASWYKYSDIRVTTLCPGLKFKFPYWLRNMYTGDAPWAMEWYDYMLHAFPYVKMAFGPAILNKLEKATDANPVMATYWETGLSFTAFIALGIQWMPFGDYGGLFFEAGVQILTPMTGLGSAGVGEEPESIITFPIKFGLVAEF
jgi:hypothetical protein